MYRSFTTYVTLITCEWNDCEAELREVADSAHMSHLGATMAADYYGWTPVGTGHRCPAHEPVSLVKDYALGAYIER